MTDVLSRRRGRFSLPAALIDSRPGAAESILSSCVPISSSYDPDSEVIDYEVLCPLFDEVEDSAPTPLYCATLGERGIIGWDRMAEQSI